MKLVTCIYTASMLAVILIGLHHAPVWLCAIVGLCFGYFLTIGLIEHIKRPVLAGGGR